jgi:hypothetical protein
MAIGYDDRVVISYFAVFLCAFATLRAVIVAEL